MFKFTEGTDEMQLLVGRQLAFVQFTETSGSTPTPSGPVLKPLRRRRSGPAVWA